MNIQCKYCKTHVGKSLEEMDSTCRTCGTRIYDYVLYDKDEHNPNIIITYEVPA